MAVELTDLMVKKLRAQKGQDKTIWDKHGLGLGVRVGPRRKTWIYRYTFDRRVRQISLGTYPAMGLKQAREEAVKAAAKVDRGIDPGVEKAAAKQAHKASPTVEEFLQEFWDVELQHKKTGKERKRLLTYDVVPEWGQRKVIDIKRRDIVLLIDKVRERAPITANRLLGVLARFFNFACERGILLDSPCARIRKTPETGRDRVLTDEELKTLWQALRLDNKKVDFYPTMKLALRLILLTGQRPGEVAGARWAEIDGDTWTIPAERMKGGVENRVPLTGAALEVLKQARMYSRNGLFVFPSPRKKDAPITAAALPHAVRKHWSGMGFEEAFRPHDLRRTLRTRLAELGIEDVIAERILGHQLQGVLKVYNRHGYDREKRAALEKWEARLIEIVGAKPKAPGVVIPFRRV